MNWDATAYGRLTRDFQRTKVYRAEHDFRAWQDDPVLIGGQIHKYVYDVIGDSWFRERFGELRFGVRVNGRRTRSAVCHTSGKTGAVTLKFPARSDWVTRQVVLHEIAHVVAKGQVHGPIFCSVLLQLVLHFQGVEAGRELYRQYTIRRVQLCG